MSDLQRILRGAMGTVACLGLFANCESSSTAVATNPESRLRLSPQELTPIAGCQQSSNDAADMSGYVATLIDVTGAGGKTKPKVVLSGPPTTCTSSITFAVSADRGDLEVGNSYVAIVDGYTATGLAPVKPDQRAVEANGSTAAPSWQWLCSFGALPDDTLASLLDIIEAIPRQPIVVTPGDAGVTSDADGTSSGAAPTPLDASSDASSDLPDARPEAGLPDASQDASLLDASPADASSRDAASDASPAAADASTSSAAPILDTTNVVAVVLDSGLLGLNVGDAAAVDATASTQSADTSETSSTATTDVVSASPLDFLREIAKDPATPIPAILAQSRLGTLRGCVALP